MDEAERDRIREYIKSKNVKPAEITPERQKEIDRVIAECAAQLKITQTGPNDYAITVRNVETGLRGGPPGEREGVIFYGVMTKSVVMALPEDSFLLSNVCNPEGAPILVQQVGLQAERGELWNKIRALRVNGRRFCVFATKAALNARLARWEQARARYQERHGG